MTQHDIHAHPCGEATETELKTIILDDERATRLGDLFRALGDANRMRIVSLLSDNELCVLDIARLLDMSQSAVSHQMRALRQLRIVSARREGRHVYYTLDDDHIRTLYRIGVEHLDEL